MIEYRTTPDGLTDEALKGFFVGWPNPPSPRTLRRILQGSYAVVVAVDAETGKAVGFINAVSDGVLSAYIPLLEVLPPYQKKGVGSKLTALMLERLEGLYMIDLACDPHLEAFYRKLGFTPSTAMIRRDYAAQAGRAG
ncbi:MAG: GNAT family N-acetyltransferase [Elusimicrobia bacterium]|nr:GNAT family N-acetyltransferase [Elusimicrobiota bacterium]